MESEDLPTMTALAERGTQKKLLLDTEGPW
jgi:hypothetical protein